MDDGSIGELVSASGTLAIEYRSIQKRLRLGDIVLRRRVGVRLMGVRTG